MHKFVVGLITGAYVCMVLCKESFALGRGHGPVAGYRLSVGCAVALHLGAHPRALVSVPACALVRKVALPGEPFVVLPVFLPPLPPDDQEGGNAEDGGPTGPSQCRKAWICSS